MWAQAGEEHTCIFAVSDGELPRNKQTKKQFANLSLLFSFAEYVPAILHELTEGTHPLRNTAITLTILM